MGALNPSRRGMLGVLAVAPLAITAAASAAPASLEAHFAAWKQAMNTIENTPGDEENLHEWAIADAAEDAILETPAAGARVAEMRLWIALHHHSLTKAHHASIVREDIASFAAGDADLEWTARVIVAAIASMRGHAAGLN